MKSSMMIIIQFSTILVIAGMLSVYFESFAESNFQTNIKKQTFDNDVNEHSVQITIVNGALNRNNDQFYSPKNMTITSGSSVTWINNDDVSHTATAKNGLFDTGLISPSKTASVTIDEKGIIEYKCAIHPWMKGILFMSDD